MAGSFRGPAKTLERIFGQAQSRAVRTRRAGPRRAEETAGHDAVAARSRSRGIAALEATGIPWAAVQRWLDDLEPREVFVARMVVKQALQALADDGAALRARFEARNELYRRLIAAGIVE